MASLEGLNAQQSAAVREIDRHLLIVAGAGSGKTRVLTHKIAYLIEDCGVSPQEIVAMTFSNKAAHEMLERVTRLLPSHEQPRWIGTFHSICLRILKEFSAEANLAEQFSIYDETDQLSVLKRVLADLNLDPKQLPPKVIRWNIDRAKNEHLDYLHFLAQSGKLTDRGLQVAEGYQKALIANQALDFGDLLIRTVRLLRESPRVAEILRGRWRRILIDEYQDTNRIQKELVLGLAGKDGIVCAVGDEDQSIYGWRGARVENILEFETDFPGAGLVKLEQNYRSTKQILEVANQVISHNKGRRGKVLWTQNADGDLVTFFQGEDDHQEAAFVLDRMEELLRQGETLPSDLAIFYRTHVQSRVFEDECRRRNRAYKVFGGTRFYDRQEVKNALAYLRLALNPADDVAFTRASQVPSRGIGEKTIGVLANVAMISASSLFDAIPLMEGGGKANKALQNFYEWFLRFRNELPELSPSKAAERMLLESGYRKSLEDEDTIEADSRLENLDELLRSMEEFEEETGGDLRTYLDRISLIADTDPYDPSVKAVTMMTAHNSKGLEFDYVFVVGMEEGIFPHQRSLDDGDAEEIEEERRLCYVAMTRARKRLYLSAAERRRVYQSTHYNPVSRFVAEIPERHLNIVSNNPAKGRYALSQDTSLRMSFRQRNARRAEFDEYVQESYDEDLPLRQVWAKAASKATANSPYAPGTRVTHPDFGMGMIRKCEGHADNLKLTIEFQRVGMKKLLLNYCELEIVDR